MELEEKTLNNPYVIQMDRFANSLQKLSHTFLRLEGKRSAFTKEEMDDIFESVKGNVCRKCEKCGECLGEGHVYTYQMVYEILCTAEEYGAELNVEVKRKLQKRCVNAPRFLREALEAFRAAKKTLLWNNKMALNRESCAIQLDTFANMIQDTTRELDASIFRDDRLEKKIKTQFRKSGIRLLSTVFFVTAEGRYEIHVTVKVGQGQCVTTKSMARILSACVGRTMMISQDERPMLGAEYGTIRCMEGPKYHTLQGVAKIGKGCDKISGDNFLMVEMPGGKHGVILSDGMGSGERAFRESAMVVEMLEELLEAGFPQETALRMMNTALVMGREEVRFSTVDMSVFDLYTGECEFVKVGASTTFVKCRDQVERIHSMSLPLGVLQEMEIGSVKRKLSHGDYIVMVTDGILDALPIGKQEAILETIIGGTNIYNPKEFAHHILEQVLEWTGEAPLDDMTVLVVGIWNV